MEDETRDERPSNREEMRQLAWRVAGAVAVGVALTLAQTWAANPDFGKIALARLRAFMESRPRPAPCTPEVVQWAEEYLNGKLRRGEDIAA